LGGESRSNLRNSLKNNEAWGSVAIEVWAEEWYNPAA
jgi:hypothetical protein